MGIAGELKEKLGYMDDHMVDALCVGLVGGDPKLHRFIQFFNYVERNGLYSGIVVVVDIKPK